ncbi:DUF1330 domain-containing protein [Roseibium sp.]|uniref:DUF1330 domain-containing protein n=1 Tax=Roseibium sp. TaxID=1936156 RepID=UPI003B51512C
MKKGYWIVHVDVTDAENYPKYLAADAIAFEKFDAHFLVRGGDMTGPEGPVRKRHVVIEFESYQTALDCYHSPEYQAAARLRQQYSDSDIVIVEGT